MSALRLGLRTHRFEVRVLAVFAIVGLLAAVLVIARLRSYGIPIDCFGGLPGTGCGPLAGAVQEYYGWEPWAGIALAGLVGMTVIPSLLLGLALSAKEVDRGTTAFVWSLTTSRRRWFLQRVGPAAMAIAVLGLVAGLLANQLEIVRVPNVDAARSFEAFGYRGFSLAGLGLTVLGVTVLVGSVVGRILPALIAALVLAIVAVVGVNLASDRLLSSETIPVRQSALYGGSPETLPLPIAEPRLVEQRLVTSSGEILTYQEAEERYGGVWEVDDLNFLPPGDELPPGAVPMVGLLLVNPGEIYPLADVRLGLLFGVVGLVSIVLAFAVIDRRRP
jgi:hypothetical protein